MHRTIYKASFSDLDLLKGFQSQVAQNPQLLGDEELIWHNPSVWVERNQWVRGEVERLWPRFSRSDVSGIERVLHELPDFEALLDEKHGEEVRRLTAAEGDLNFFEAYDRPWDYMRSGLLGVSSNEMALLHPLLSDEHRVAVEDFSNESLRESTP